MSNFTSEEYKMFVIPPLLNRNYVLRISLAALATMGSQAALAGSVGPGSATVNAGDTIESWTVRNGGTLNVNAGAVTDFINVQNSGSMLFMNGAVTSSATNIGVEFNNSSSGGTIANSRVSSASTYGVLVAGLQPGTPDISINNSIIDGVERGVSVARTGATLAGTQVLGRDDGNTGFLYGGVGLALFNATVNVTDGSVIKGDMQGVLISPDGGGPLDSTLNIDNSKVEGLAGSAIIVGSFSGTRHSEATILVSNGSELTGGNGIVLEVANNSTANFTVDNSQLIGDVYVESGSNADVVLDNNASLTGKVTNAESLTTSNGGQWTVTGDSDVGSLTNGGTIAFSTGSTGRTLTVGNYTGNDGLLVFNSVLGADDSATDKLVVTGDTQGTSKVAVNNLGGSGAKTVEGIELISVGGISAGEFSQQGRIVAGAYDYQLIRGSGSNAANWYLSSSRPVDPVDPVDPTDPTNPVDPTDPTDPTNPVDPVDPITPPDEIQVLRPEAGAYTSNLAAANTMFALSLDDRLGETEYTDAITGEQRLTSMWMHVSGGHNRSHDNSGQLSIQANRYVTMLGGDVATGTGNNGSAWRLGALAGYGNSRSNTVSDITGYRAKGEVDGYTTGLYGTWYANGTDESGLYVDSVLQYSWFDNTVSGEDIASESYNSKGFSASVESGYVFALSHSFFLQPKAQLAWSGIRADDHTEVNGTRVSGTGNDNLRSSLGIKAFMKGNSSLDDGKNRTFKPFAEANWIHNTENYGVLMDDVSVSQAGTRNIAEAKIGVEGRITPQLNLTGSVAQQIGDNSWSDTAGMLGVKYSF